MKTIKLLFTAILMMMAMCVQAQTVQVYKNGQVVKEYPASDVKSVQVKQAYFYYAGWECPRNEEELASKGTLIENYESLTSASIIKDYISNPIENDNWEDWYIIIPSKLKVVDADGTEVTFQSNIKASWNSNYSIIKSDSPDFELGTVKLVVR